MSRYGRRYKALSTFRRFPFLVYFTTGGGAAPVVLAFADGTLVVFSDGALVAL